LSRALFAFVPAAAAAVWTWAAVLVGWRAQEYLAKPATMALLAIGAALLRPVAEPVHWMIVIGLLLGGLGDVLLMTGGGVSPRALAPFLAGHLAYVLAFTAQRQNLLILVPAGLVCLAAILVYQRWLLAGLRAMTASYARHRIATAPVRAEDKIVEEQPPPVEQ